MVDEKAIGQKVWVLTEDHYRYTLDKSKVYTVVSIKLYSEVKDHTNHAILRGEDGKEIEVRDYNVLFIPDPNLEGDEQIARFLKDNLCYPDCVYTNSEGVTSVDISWGDWKHEHLWCRDLMGYLGYIETNVEETEEDGSDCYSAIHYFVKNK